MRNMHLPEGIIEQHKISIKILGPLKEISESSVFEVTARKGENILDILKKLPAELRGRIIKDDEISPDLLVLVDGVEASCLGRLEEVSVNDVKEIILIPVIHGG